MFRQLCRVTAKVSKASTISSRPAVLIQPVRYMADKPTLVSRFVLFILFVSSTKPFHPVLLHGLQLVQYGQSNHIFDKYRHNTM